MIDYWITYIRFAGYNLKCRAEQCAWDNGCTTAKNADARIASRIVDIKNAFLSLYWRLIGKYREKITRFSLHKIYNTRDAHSASLNVIVEICDANATEVIANREFGFDNPAIL